MTVVKIFFFLIIPPPDKKIDDGKNYFTQKAEVLTVAMKIILQLIK